MTMTLTDQQLRQELVSFGETVPPITQRNREQLRARLELLRSQTRTRTPASPSRSQAAASPSRSKATASPSRVQITAASPSRMTRATASPSSRAPANASPTRATTASPSRTTITNSPSRTRSSTTATSRPSTRSQQATSLIELSDSDTESRQHRAGQISPTIQTRSTGTRRQKDSPSTSSSVSELAAPPNITNDVEESIARHRREIKQLLDSARDRNRIATANDATEPTGTPLRPLTRSRADHQATTTNDNQNRVQQSPSSKRDQPKKPSFFVRIGKSVQSFWKTKKNTLMKIFKMLFLTILLGSGTYCLVQNMDKIFPPAQEINCSIKNATTCENMEPIIATVRKQLNIRTGEVECGFRDKNDILVKKPEIEKFLNDKGIKFTLGDAERWNTLITYILDKPISDILVWDNKEKRTNIVTQAVALSTKEALRSIMCRAQQDISEKTRNLISLILIGIISLAALGYFLRKKNKSNEDNEDKFHNLLERVTKLLEEQYEKHLQDPKTQPWLVINQIREKLISEKDQEKLKHIWERVKEQMNGNKSLISSETQEVDGKDVDVWRLAKSSPMKTRSQTAKKSHNEEVNAFLTTDIGLTECLKLRNCFRSDNYANEKETDQVTNAIRNRCANVKQIEHIGTHSTFVYIKFSSKEAAGQAYDLLNNWNYQGRTINVKYIRHSRYNEHFPEARNASPNK